MKRILGFIIAVLIAQSASAQDTATKLTRVGINDKAAAVIAGLLTNGPVLPNASFIQGRNAGDTANINMIGITAADDTLINSSALDDLILRLEDDANRLITFDAGSDAALLTTWGDGGTTATQVWSIRASTADTDDDSTLRFGGGGDIAVTQGAFLILYGNETSSNGAAELYSGSDAGADVTVAPIDDFIILSAQDSNRKLIYESSSDTVMQLLWGDSSTTALQTMYIVAGGGADDDDTQLLVAGGSDANSAEGGFLTLNGNEFTGAGDVMLSAGGIVGSKLALDAPASNGTVDFLSASQGIRWQMDSNGILKNLAAGSAGNLELQATGTTLAIQEATAGSACSGTLTANGATPVVTSTTCAKTGARIFLQRTGAETGTVNAWISALSNGVSFSITSEAADTGAYNWIIFHEAG